ncbi:MAG: proline iminopeptidase-family hydrolase [Bacteroidia bacterium]|nr:proline iminopeptidase-family hydrolase [Bacteroidia bacterium]
MTLKKISLILLTIILISSCSEKRKDDKTNNYFSHSDSGVQDGGIKIIEVTTLNKKFKVWTKKIGNNPRIKVLLLNGGPGLTHEYFECFESFFPEESIEFIYYDQLGCGNSDNPDDTAFWELDRYVEEVEQVRVALHLDKDNFYLLGHSWGGILAMQYALKYQNNMKALIVSNMMCSCPDYGRYADEVLSKQMRPDVLDTINAIEARGDFNNPRYMALLMPEFYAKHLCRIPLDQWPEPVNRSMKKVNSSLYITMQGPSEFGISGRLANWDIKSKLKDITTPVLTIGAKHDTMDPEHMKWMAEQVKNGSFLFCPNGSHMSFYDDQQTYFTGLIKYIQGIDGGKNKVDLK